MREKAATAMAAIEICVSCAGDEIYKACRAYDCPQLYRRQKAVQDFADAKSKVDKLKAALVGTAPLPLGSNQ
jgi:hypothetical protein